ncbi:MAG: uracil phosphoribosyltransferase [Bacteroidia bacterium]|jgi:uracil phosphoribosyltransferase
MLTVNNLSEQSSIVHQLLTELRDVTIQHDRYRFRKNIERFGMIAAYEISKSLEYHTVDTQTPLAKTQTQILANQPVIATVLRAGLPLQNGVNQLFNQADLAYISAYRKHISELKFKIVVEYLACPDLTNRVLILTDPMLATGQSLVLTLEQFLTRGRPSHIHIVSVIGSPEGIEYLEKNSTACTLWIGAIDEKLDDHGYIIPGLGDAGDLSFGQKMDPS